MTNIQVKNKLSSIKKDLQNKFHIKNIGIFGSYATGENRKNSDLDILVDFENGHYDYFNYYHTKAYLEKAFGIKIDLVLKNTVRKELKKNILNQVQYA